MGSEVTAISTSELTIDVAFTSAFVEPDIPRRRRTTYIVVDVIRATTTLCVLFERGCRQVLLAPSIRAGREARRARDAEWLLAGEAGGIAPQGFDFGNSPAEFARQDLRTRAAIFATTNGTRAIRACLGGRTVFAGALRNAEAVSRAAVTITCDEANGDNSEAGQPESDQSRGGASESQDARDVSTASDIVIVCAGRLDRPAYDDTICAGYLARRITRVAESLGRRWSLREGARIAVGLVEHIEQTASLRDALATSDAARATERVGLAGDLDWCAAVDVTDIVPAVTSLASGDDLVAIEPFSGRAGGR